MPLKFMLLRSFWWPLSWPRQDDAGTDQGCAMEDMEAAGIDIEEAPAVVEEAQVADGALGGLEWGAQKLENHFAERVRRWSEFQDVSASTAHRRIHAAARVALQEQSTALERTVSVLRTMQTVGSWRCILFLEHALYDETPLQIRVALAFPGQKDRQHGKVHVAEHGWTIVVQQLEGSTCGAGSMASYTFLKGNFSPQIRAAGNATGETIYAVLSSMEGAPLSSGFWKFSWSARP